MDNASLDSGGQAVTAFLFSIQDRLPDAADVQWNGDVSAWTDEDVASLVRAIAKDYLADFGEGYKWGPAGHQAAFMLCSLYYDLHEGQMPPWHLSLAPEGIEGFDVSLRISRQMTLPPVPTLEGAGAMQVNSPDHSVMVASVARQAADFDALGLPAILLAQSTRQFIALTGLTDRRGVILSAALFTLWKACQFSGVVKGGAIFRNIQNPNQPEQPAQSVRLNFERTGPAAAAALLASVDGGAYLLR